MAKGGLLNNVKLLYFVFLLSVINLSYFVFNKDSQSIFIFAALALIVYFFNKNMIVVLLITMFVINLLVFINAITKEGLENKNEPANKTDKPKIKKIRNEVDEIDSSEELLNTKLNKSNYPEVQDKVNNNIKDILPLTKMLDGLDITQINRMINNLNNIIEKF
jgi:hypothetical protein